MPSALAYACL